MPKSILGIIHTVQYVIYIFYNSLKVECKIPIATYRCSASGEYICVYIYRKKVKTLFDTFFSFYFFFYGRNKIQTISNWHPFVKQSNFEWFSSFFACVLFECRFIYLQPFFSNGKKKMENCRTPKRKTKLLTFMG